MNADFTQKCQSAKLTLNMFVFRDAGRGGGVRVCVCDRDNFKFNKISPIYVNNRVKEGKPYKSIYILPSQYTGKNIYLKGKMSM